jgi:hypothetical protein
MTAQATRTELVVTAGVLDTANSRSPPLFVAVTPNAVASGTPRILAKITVSSCNSVVVATWT